MLFKKLKKIKSTSIRNKVLGAVGALIVLSLLSSTISLIKITKVNHSIQSINQLSVPLEKNLARIRSDAEVLKRELEQTLGFENWKNTEWSPRPLSPWMIDVLEDGLVQIQFLIQDNEKYLNDAQKKIWTQWYQKMSLHVKSIKENSSRLYFALEKEDYREASVLYPQWMNELDLFLKETEWGSGESERFLRTQFQGSHELVSELRSSLQGILGAVLILSLLLVWIGERALRPLVELTRIVKGISARGGVMREDRLQLPEVILGRNDEVSELISEFKNMATHLLEREKTVEIQKENLQEQNKLLTEMGVLNETIFNSIRSALIVTDFNARITQYNAEAAQWLNKNNDELIGKNFFEVFSQSNLLEQCPEEGEWKSFFEILNSSKRIQPFQWGQKTIGGVFLPLKHISSHKLIRSLGKWWNPEVGGAQSAGAIFILEDMTEQVELTHRLNLAEKLAAIGQMSAQVAHEIRNPLHSIGLEAEVALERSQQLQSPSELRQSLQSILQSVDRLEKITENYLKLSRLSQGTKVKVNLLELLEKVLATYSTLFEKNKIDVQWQKNDSGNYHVFVDSDLMENVLGNLYKNSVEALAEKQKENPEFYPVIYTSLSLSEDKKQACLRVQDNGPGLSEKVKHKLFTPFLTTKPSGTGLGLSFVKRVVEENNGSIRVQNFDEPLSGVLFEIIFPVVPLKLKEGPMEHVSL